MTIYVVDSQGDVVQGVVVTKPLTLVYHYQLWEMQDLDLNPNEIHFAWSGALATAETTHQSTAGLVMPATNNARTRTLTAQTNHLVGILTGSGSPEIETPSTPDLFSVSGNAGQYTYTYPLDVAPGPAGFAPRLALIYSSQSTNSRYSARAPAGDEGEGWSLSLGSITATVYPSSAVGGGGTYYSLNNVDGTSDMLVPASGHAGYYETQHISHLLVHFTGSYWQVWGLDGTYSEFGNTTDSVRTDASGTYEWDLNKVLAPYNNSSQLKMLLVSYIQDVNSSTTRDAGIKQIQYGLATSTSATTLSQVMGTVDFHYHMPSVPSGDSAFATAYGTNYNCQSAPPASTTLRCDDTVSENGVTAPDVMSTMSLDSVTSYVGTDSSGSPAYHYTLSYQDLPYNGNWFDAYTQVQEAAAGEHLLTQITPSVYVQGTADQRANTVFAYSSPLQDLYRDPSQKTSSGNSQYGGETFWRYLTHMEDLETGEGANITYARAFSNTHGTPYITDGNGNVTDDRLDPLYCTTNASNPNTSLQCIGSYLHPEDYSWSQEVVTQIAALGTDSTGNQTEAVTTYNYALTPVASGNMPGSANCNPITGTGVPAEEADCVQDTYSPYYSLADPAKDGNWLNYYDEQYRGFNVVYSTSPAGDLTVGYYFATQGWYTPSWEVNAHGGQLYQQDSYQGDVAIPEALMQETLQYYASGTGNIPAGNPYTTIDLCHGLDDPVYNPCVSALMETKTTTYDEQGGSSSAPWVDTKYSYDDVNPSTGLVAGYHNLTQEVISSSNAATITKKWTYTPDDQGPDQGGSGQQYYDVNKVTHSEIDDSSVHVWQCEDTTYDEGRPSGVPTPDAGLATTVTDYSTCGNSATAITSYTGYDQYGNVVATVDPLGVANPSFYSSEGCTLSTAPVDVTASWTSGHYTTCTTYDTSHSAGLPVSQTNALGQETTASYDYTSGAFESSSTDANAQPTSFVESFDSSGNERISTSEPGEIGSYTTKQSEHSSCVDSLSLPAGSQDLYPCYEIDTVSSLYSSAVTQTFYDSQGRKIETITPGPTPGDDTVVLSVYNDQRHSVWTTEPFEIAAGSYGTGWINPSAVNDVNNTPPAGTVTFYDALGRAVAMQDENYNSSQEPGITCSATLSGTFTSCTNYSFAQVSGDSNFYAETTSVDANGHVTATFADVLGNTRYAQTFTGVYGGTLTVAQQVQTQYNALNEPTSVATTDEQPQSGETTTSVTVSYTYDDLGRVLTMSDPDRGTFTSSYDPDGNVLSVVQTSGSSSRTIGINYDLLGRPGCEQTAAPTINATGACSAGNPLVQNTYDTNELGTQGSTDFPVGELTQSIATTYYPDSTSATVTEQAQYDQRGRTTVEQMHVGLPSSWNVTTALPTDQVTEAYNDANQLTTTTASTGSQTDTFTQVYDATNGVLQGLSDNTSVTANLAQLAYSEFSQLGGITLLNGASSSPSSLASETFNYDADLRPTSLSATWLPASGNSGQILGQSRAYDNASNVTGSTTTYAPVSGVSGSGGSETQNFCYDEQNRLIWAGNGGTQPGSGNGTCGSGTLANSLSGAGYTTPYTSTNLGQIWQGPLNGSGTQEQYLYCQSAPHELTGVYPTGTTCANKGSATAVYSASYDPWGNETSRTYQSITETLSYDALNHLVEESGTNSTQEYYVYDGSGTRVLTRSTSAGTTSLTVYAFGLQELTYTSTGAFSSQLDYYTIAGYLVGWSNGSTITYALTDAEGSVLLTFSASAVLGEQDYGPYGNQRYIQGTIGTDKGYTGQFVDAVTELDYYGARWYDPVSEQFLSADSVQGNTQGMNPYAYVGGNPETFIDPSGQRAADGGEGGDNWDEFPVPGSYAEMPGVSGGPEPSGAGPEAPNDIANPDPVPPMEASSDETGATGEITSGEFDKGLQVDQQELHDEHEYYSQEEEHQQEEQPSKSNQPNQPDQSNQPDQARGSSQDDNSPNTSSSSHSQEDPDAGQFWRGSSLNNAPTFTSPGTSTLQGIHVNDLGQEEPYTAYYNEYGMQIGRTDYTAGNDADGTPPIHSHGFTYVHPDFPQGLGLPPDLNHVPGEFDPLILGLFWLF